MNKAIARSWIALLTTTVLVWFIDTIYEDFSFVFKYHFFPNPNNLTLFASIGTVIFGIVITILILIIIGKLCEFTYKCWKNL